MVMTHSLQNSEKWPEILSAQTGVALGQDEVMVWFRELRRTVRGWEHSTAESSDPCRGKKAVEINAELCNALRHVGAMQTLPRKKDEYGGKGTGRITVADVALWVWMYRRDKTTAASAEQSDPHMIEAGKAAISKLNAIGDRRSAACLAYGNSTGCQGEIHAEFFAGLPNRAFTAYEQGQLAKHFRAVTGEFPNAFFERTVTA